MSTNKILDGREYEKLDVVSITINGEYSENLLKEEDLSELAKDGPIIINIQTNTLQAESITKDTDDNESIK